MANSQAYAEGQEELQNRLKNLREQKDVVVGLIEDMLRRVELAASHAATVTNMNEFYCHFVTAAGSMNQMYMVMFQVHALLTSAEVFGGKADHLRAPMAITYSFPGSNDQNGAQAAPLETNEGLSCLPSTSLPPSVGSPHLSVCDETFGPQPAPVIPQQSEPHAAALSPVSPVYMAPRGRRPVLAPSSATAYTSPGAPSTVEAPLSSAYRVPGSPLAGPLTPAMAGGPRARAVFATSPPSLAYGGPGALQQFAAPAACAVRGALPELLLPATPGYESPEAQFMAGRGTMHKLPSPPGYRSPGAEFMAGRGALPELLLPATPGYASPEAQFMAGRGTLHKLPSPPGYTSPGAEFMAGRGALPELRVPLTPAYPSSGAQLTVEPACTGTGAPPKLTTPLAGPAPPSELDSPPATMHMGHAEMPSRSATPYAEAPERAVPTPESVAPPPAQSAAPPARKSVKRAVKEDARNRGDARSLLDEADRMNNYSQPQGERKPAGRKAGVSVPPGFTSSHRQPLRIVTNMKSLSPGNSSSQRQPLITVTAGSVKSQSPGSHKYFDIPPADSSLIGTTQKVVLSFYKTPSEFWLQLVSSGEVLESLLKDLTTYYRSKTSHQEFEARVGMHCVAHFTVDDHWYRAQILELLPDHAMVSYVDFGNCDRVPLKKLCLLAEQFASLPAQAYNCSIKGLFPSGRNRTWPLSAVRLFRGMMNPPETKLEAVFYFRDSITRRFIVDILGKTEDMPVVNLSQEFLTIFTPEALKPLQVPPYGSMEKVEPTAQQPPAVGAPSGGPPGSELPAIAPPGTAEQRATSPHTTASRVGVPTRQDSMISVPISASAEAAMGVVPQTVRVPVPPATAILATGPPPASTPPAAEPPAAARVAPHSVTSAVVPEAAKPAAPRAPARPAAGVPLAGVLSEEAVARMSRKPSPLGVVHAVLPPGTVSPPLLPAAAVCPPSPLPTVVLPPGIPPAVLPDGKTFTFILSVVFNPSDFYGQILAQDSTPQMLEELQQQLNQQGSASSPPPPASVTKGTFWICFYEGDKNWYRAQVLEVGNTANGRRARVLYVDYGNRSVVQLKNLRPLPEHLAKPPACALRMALALVNPARASRWGESATKTFVNETGFKTVLVAEKRGQRQAGLETITEVVLWNKNGETPVNINILLVEKNLAQLKSA